MKRKKVVLYAYDRINLGDDLFVHTIVNRYPDVEFYLWSSTINKTTFWGHNNLKILDQKSPWLKLLKKIRPSFAACYKNSKEKACDAVVYIGGSLFIEYENWKQINSWWEYESRNRNFYVIGANFGPYHTKAYRDSFSSIFANMKDVCLRDRFSQALFSEVDTVRYAPDILFSYPMSEKHSDKKQVFVSVIDCLSKDEGSNKLADYNHFYMETITELLNGFIHRGYKVVLSSFCKVEGDEKTVERICESLPSDKTQVVNYDGRNAGDVLDTICESSFVIASRFHAVILGLAADKPVLPIIYSDKTTRVLEDVGFTGARLDIRHLEKIDIESLLFNDEKQRLSNIEKIKKQSECHFQKLDQLLKASL